MRISVELPEFTREEVGIIAAALDMTQQPGQHFYIDKMWWGQNRQLCIAAIETVTPEFSIQGLKSYISDKLVKAFSTPGNTLVMKPGVDGLLRKLNLAPVHDNAEKKKELVKYAADLKAQYYQRFENTKASIIQEFDDAYNQICATKEQRLREAVASYKDLIAKVDADLAQQIDKL